VPAWRDLQPESGFLRSLLTAALPASVHHHVFYGYREDGSSYDTDGVISVASQLAAKGERAHGFLTDHSDIIESAPVFKAFASVLAAFN
jgi:hypothetical protein